MEINDELLACYIEGTATSEECDMVREYLCKCPEEYERVLSLMDNDKTDYLNERVSNHYSSPVTDNDCRSENACYTSVNPDEDCCDSANIYDHSMVFPDFIDDYEYKSNNNLYDNLDNMWDEMGFKNLYIEDNETDLTTINIMEKKIAGEPIPFPGLSPEETQQQFNDTCAVKSQQIIMKTFGIDIPEAELALESYEKGYYVPGWGSDPDLVGKLLNDHGIPTHNAENANVYDLVGELAQGHKIIVGVDSSELWKPTWYNDILGETPDHALLVTGIDTTDPENVKVIITDPGTGDVAKEYPLEQFIDAWSDSNCFYVSTNEAPPAESNAEMIGFDYDAGHIPFICDIPYDMYLPMQYEFDIFHDSIIQGMHDCLNRLNNVSPEMRDDMISEQGKHMAEQFEHMHKTSQIFQKAWETLDGSLPFSIDMEAVTHSVLFDYWDAEAMISSLPEGIDLMDFETT